MQPKMEDMNTWLNIRRAEAKDSAALARIFLESRLEAFYWQNPARFRLEDFEKETAGEMVFVAEDGSGKILGFISVWEPEWFVHHLYISPDQQRRGIGKRLLESLSSWLPLPYRLKCKVKNAAACAFYRKHGWVETGRDTDEQGEYLVLEFHGSKEPC
jgi:ribosomal protein S18 acetylase RimI-like enzyme